MKLKITHHVDIESNDSEFDDAVRRIAHLIADGVESAVGHEELETLCVKAPAEALEEEPAKATRPAWTTPGFNFVTGLGWHAIKKTAIDGPILIYSPNREPCFAYYRLPDFDGGRS